MTEARTQLAAAFRTALSAPDADFASYLEKLTAFHTIGAVMLNGASSLPAGQSLDSMALAAFAQPDKMPFHTQVEMAPPATEHRNAPNNTGIRSYIPMAEGEMSVARYNNVRTVTLNQHVCSSCSGPAAARQMGASCEDLSDPAQVRGGQLVRMAIGLHEAAHAVFFYAVSGSGLAQEEKMNLLRSQTHNETFADAFAAINIIRELGPEGITFMRQYAAGFRDTAHTTQSYYGATTNTLAQIISAAEQDPKLFADMSDTGIARVALEAVRHTVPDSTQANTLHSYLKEKGMAPREGEPPLQGATTRLAWYAEQQALAQRGAEHAKDILPLYERFVLPGDRILMTPDALQQNLQHMVDLGPLKNNPDWQQQAQAATQECRAPQRPVNPTAPSQ